MKRDELNENELFLNSKEVPTPLQIAKLFFSDENFELLGTTNEDEFNIEDVEGNGTYDPEIDFSQLGEADEVETIQGTEWVISKLVWNQDKRVLCKINLIKLNNVLDIGYEDVTNVQTMTFDERLDIAIEDENFEEAARLRDWNAGFIDLLKELQPIITEAIRLEDVDTLEKCQKQISDYKSKL